MSRLGIGVALIYSLVLGCAAGGYSRARVVGVYGKGGRHLRSRFLAGEALFAASTPPWTPPLFKLEGALGERAFDDDFVLGSPSLVLARRAFFSSPPTAPALPSVLFLPPSPGRSPERL